MAREKIYRRKDGRFEARYVKRIKADGTVVYGSCYGRTHKEAREKRRQIWTQDSFIRESDDLSGISFARISQKWIEKRRGEIKESTRQKYQCVISRHLLPVFGSEDLLQITPEKVLQFRNRMLEEKQLSSASMRTIFIVFNSIMKEGVRSYDPQMLPVLISLPRLESRKVECLTHSQQQRLSEYLLRNRSMTNMLLYLSLTTGIRLGEACALKWGDFDFHEGTLQIRATVQRLKSEKKDSGSRTALQVSSPKTNQAVRIIPLTPGALEYCRQYRSGDNQYVSTGSEAVLDPRTLQNRLKKTAGSCGIEYIHFHMLRHTFATRWIEESCDLKCLSEILGHSSVQITLDRYVHLTLEMKKKEIYKIAEAFIQN